MEFVDEDLVHHIHTQPKTKMDSQRVFKEWSRVQVKKQPEKFEVLKSLTVRAVTWNTNGKFPTESKHVKILLEKWLKVSTQEKKHNPDILAIGMQEIDMSVPSLVFEETTASTKWRHQLLDILHRIKNAKDSKSIEYVCIVSKQIVGMFVMVLLKKKLIKHFVLDSLRVESINCGVLNFGNKGGIGVFFRLHNTTLAFVNAHLNAHPGESNGLKRNEQWAEINSRVMEHRPDVVFWMGDLNYRIENIKPNECMRMIKEDKVAKLLELDGLNLMRKEGKVFGGYLPEHTISFLPTYKYEEDNPDPIAYDLSDETRLPSYCDRILLFVGKRKCRAKQTEYVSVPDMLISDHKPVSACFELSLPLLHFRLLRELFLDYVNKEEKEKIPKAKLAPREVSLIVGEKEEGEVLLENIGKCSLEFEVLYSHDASMDVSAVKALVSVTPDSGAVLGGDSKSIVFRLRHPPLVGTASEHFKSLPLSHFFIFKLKNGSDYFVTLSLQHPAPKQQTTS